LLLCPFSSEGQVRATEAEEVEASSVFIIDLAFTVCNFMRLVSAHSMQAFAMDRGRYMHRPLLRSIHMLWKRPGGPKEEATQSTKSKGEGS